MGSFWTEKQLAMYQDACDFLHYPEIPLKKYFDELIRPDDAVLDIGSGPGAVSLYLAPLCKSVTAIEQDADACRFMQRQAEARGIKNMEIINDYWPCPVSEVFDVSIMCYVFRIMDQKEKIRSVLDATRKAGILLSSQGLGNKHFFHSIYNRLGLEAPASTSRDPNRTVSLLEMEGVKVRCDNIVQEFGQPVNDLDDAALFLRAQLGLGAEYLPKIREIAEEYTEIREGRLYVSKKVPGNIIVFEK